MTKKDNKRFVVRRVRRALNHAETPPMQTGNVLIRFGYGTGAGQKQVDAKDDHAVSDYEWMFYWGEDFQCCDMCESCLLYADADEGVGWSFEAANDMDPPKLGDLIAA